MNTTTTPTTTCKKCGGRLNRAGACLLCPMFASGETPSCVSDTTRFTGDRMGGRQFGNDVVREAYLAKARAAGVTTDGKLYFSSLARFPGDPEAWMDAQGDQVKLLQKRGWSAEGDVNVKGPDVAPLPAVRLAEDLVEARVEEELERRYPDAVGGKKVRIKKKEFRDIREAVIEKHGAPLPGRAPQYKLGPPDPKKPKGKRPKAKK
jgi:hypothetical protein